MRERYNNDRAQGAELYAPTKSIGHDNARYKNRNIRYYINNEGALMPRPSRKDTQKMANNSNIFIVSSSDASTSDLAFASLGTALQYVRDSHEDENAEGLALMLQTPRGLVEESTSAVRDRTQFNLPCRFVAAADAGASKALRSKLDGAIKACALIGVEPDSVAKVTELRQQVEAAQADVSQADDSVSYTITPMTLQKRKGARRS